MHQAKTAIILSYEITAKKRQNHITAETNNTAPPEANNPPMRLNFVVFMTKRI